MSEKNYSVARVVQYSKDGIGKAERHIERKNESYENMNVDLSRSSQNVHFKGFGKLTYGAYLDKQRIAGFGHEADLLIRRYLKKGRALKEKPEEKWAEPWGIS